MGIVAFGDRAPLLGFKSEYVTGIVTRLVIVTMKYGKNCP